MGTAAEAVDRALAAVAARQAEVVDLCRALVAAPSPNPPGDERAPAAVVAAYLEGTPGATVRTLEPVPRRSNVVAAAGGRPGDPALLLTGHLDTFSLDGDWARDPLGGDARRGGIVDGRGSTDIKGGVAALAVAFRALVELGLPDGARLLLVANADEETGGRDGWEALLPVLDESPEAALVAEPSGVDDPFEALYVGARGTTRCTLRAEGTRTHSSLAGRSNVTSALEALEAVVGRLRAGLPWPGCGDARVTVVRLAGGDGWGAVPGSASADVEIRVAPPADRSTAEAAVRTAVGAVDGVELSWAPGGLRWMSPSAIDPGHGLVASATVAWTRVLGAPPALDTFPGGTDAQILQHGGIPSVIAGPGALVRAHKPDEWVEEADLGRAAALYAATAAHYVHVSRGAA